MRQPDQLYFKRRAAEEYAAASRAEDPRARQSHLELAHRYEVVVAANAGAPVVQLAVSIRDGARVRKSA